MKLEVHSVYYIVVDPYRPTSSAGNATYTKGSAGMFVLLEIEARYSLFGIPSCKSNSQGLLLWNLWSIPFSRLPLPGMKTLRL